MKLVVLLVFSILRHNDVIAVLYRKKYGIFAILTKNKVICDTESIYMSILADEACRFTSFFNITS